MTQSSWVNPNGLPADEQISSARDLAILARALIHDFPEYDMYWHIPAIQLGKKYDAQLQHADRPLRGRRRHEDRLHLRLRLQSGGDRVAQRQAADRRGARRAVVALSRGEGRGPARARLPSRPAVLAVAVARLGRTRCSRSMPRRPICATRCAGRIASARPPKRPTTTANRRASCCRTCRPSTGKASALLKERPDAVKAIAVFIGAAKNAAENQFANARAKIQKLAKGKPRPTPRPQPPRRRATGDRRQGHRRRRCRPFPRRRPAPSRRRPASRSGPCARCRPRPTSAIRRR